MQSNFIFISTKKSKNTHDNQVITNKHVITKKQCDYKIVTKQTTMK